MSKEVETGTFSDEDEVCGAVSQVGSRREAFRAARTSTAHAGSVYSEELSSNRPPLATTLWMKKKKQTDLTLLVTPAKTVFTLCQKFAYYSL